MFDAHGNLCHLLQAAPSKISYQRTICYYGIHILYILKMFRLYIYILYILICLCVHVPYGHVFMIQRHAVQKVRI